MAMLIREMLKTYNYLVYDLSDKRMAGRLLVDSPIILLLILIGYVRFVNVTGPRLMANRKPFNIDRILQVYNVCHIVMAIYIVERGISLGWNFNGFNWVCVPVDYSETPDSLAITNAFHIFFLIKMADLMDTIFFVLRKRNRQITFLHVYHHTGMVVATWIGVKYFPGGHHTLIGVINSIVHAVMYSYYLVTSIYPQHKDNIWWKKHITQMQMIQFLVLAIHQCHVIFQPTCDYPKGLSMILVPQNFFFFILFLDFYRKTYGSGKKQSRDKEPITD